MIVKQPIVAIKQKQKLDDFQETKFCFANQTNRNSREFILVSFAGTIFQTTYNLGFPSALSQSPWVHESVRLLFKNEWIKPARHNYCLSILLHIRMETHTHSKNYTSNFIAIKSSRATLFKFQSPIFSSKRCLSLSPAQMMKLKWNKVFFIARAFHSAFFLSLDCMTRASLSRFLMRYTYSWVLW